MFNHVCSIEQKCWFITLSKTNSKITLCLNLFLWLFKQSFQNKCMIFQNSTTVQSVHKQFLLNSCYWTDFVEQLLLDSFCRTVVIEQLLLNSCYWTVVIEQILLNSCYWTVFVEQMFSNNSFFPKNCVWSYCTM